MGVGGEAMSGARSLVRSFEAGARPGGESFTEMMGIINRACGTAYTINDLAAWRRGAKSIPKPVAAVMLRTCIAHVVESEAGPLALGDEAWGRIADALIPPDRR